MIYTLTVNPSIDYIMHVDVKPDTLNRSAGESVYPGGKGINVSVMLANLGCESIALGVTAGSTGKLLKEMLRPYIKTDFVHIEDGITRINVKAVGENTETEINGSGVKVDFDMIKGKLGNITKDDYLVISGSFDDYHLVHKIVEAVDTDKIVFDIPEIEYALDYKPFFIKPNLAELEKYFRCEIKKDEMEKYCRRLLTMGCRNVMISLGADGAFFCNRNFAFWRDAEYGDVVSTVGAGDSMVAGMLYGMVNEMPVEDTVRLATACGSATAFCEHIASKRDVEKLYGKI